MIACQGSACSVVEVSWDEDAAGYRITNTDNRTVRIVLAGFNYSLAVRLGPKEEQIICVEEFEPPMLAEFCD